MNENDQNIINHNRRSNNNIIHRYGLNNEKKTKKGNKKIKSMN